MNSISKAECRVDGLMAYKVKMSRILDPTVRVVMTCKTKADQDKCFQGFKELLHKDTSMKLSRAGKIFEVYLVGVGKEPMQALVDEVKQSIGIEFGVNIVSHTRKWIGVTLLWMPDATVVGVRKYGVRSAVQLGVSECRAARVANPQRVESKKLGVPCFQVRREFGYSGDNPSVGQKVLSPDVFSLGDIVSVSGQTIGRGMTGAMKRWNFSGTAKTHGVSLAHRALGSTGCCVPNRVFKNKKMAGHYGNEQVTTQGLEVLDIDAEQRIVAVRGAVPGKQGWVRIRRAHVNN